MSINTNPRPAEFVATFIEPPTWAQPAGADTEDRPESTRQRT